MKIKLWILIFMVGLTCFTSAQLPNEVYKTSLKAVLIDIEKRYDIKIEYTAKFHEGLVKGVDVLFPTWRYRVDVDSTLSNILKPLFIEFEKVGDSVYKLTDFSYYRQPVEEGKERLDHLLASYPTLQIWEARKSELRKCFMEQWRLSPFPRKTPLNPIYTPKRVMEGYTIENVAIETLPGVYLCGSLYRPAKGKGPFAAVLSPHGHFGHYDTDQNEYGRYRPDQQYRCATLARMGAVVFSYEMFGWGESLLQVRKEDHRTGLAATMQILNSIRVTDFLTSLSYVDPKRIGVTGGSGGGTQSFFLTAVDDRIIVSVPVVMLSYSFFGACPCGNGLPVYSCSDPGTNNVEIAAMTAPRPMLVISDGEDWTQNVPAIEFPFLQKVYGIYEKQQNVENVHLANEGHDYGLSKRLAMYDFMARHLGLNINAVKDKAGKIDESKCTIEKYDKMLVFGKEGNIPGNAVKGPDAIWTVLRSLQENMNSSPVF